MGAEPSSLGIGSVLEPQSPKAALLDAIKDFTKSPPTFATANKKGNFPMAALEGSPDGASLDTVPLTHACTTRSFDKIKILIVALLAWQQAEERAADQAREALADFQAGRVAS